MNKKIIISLMALAVMGVMTQPVMASTVASYSFTDTYQYTKCTGSKDMSFTVKVDSDHNARMQFFVPHVLGESCAWYYPDYKSNMIYAHVTQGSTTCTWDFYPLGAARTQIIMHNGIAVVHGIADVNCPSIDFTSGSVTFTVESHYSPTDKLYSPIWYTTTRVASLS